MPTKKRSLAQKLRKPAPAAPEAALFDRVAGIIEQAQTSVVRAVNSSMVLAYWLIGREIVRELQGGQKRAAYGKEVLADLSKRLGERYGRGFSITNLQNFRLFHLTYANRVPEIQHIGCAESAATEEREFPPTRTRRIGGSQSQPQEIQHIGSAVLEHLSEAAEQVDAARGFSPNLGWSHHCILKCYVLIDLKLGKLTHQDAGQMDSYVRIYDDLCRSPGDNPTIGLILCSEKSGAIARYSVLHESKQIFASTYVLHLPTEEELRREIERERRLIEERAAARDRKSKPSI
jgi:hypothetical protein